jgi:hypothetical protein
MKDEKGKHHLPSIARSATEGTFNIQLPIQLIGWLPNPAKRRDAKPAEKREENLFQPNSAPLCVLGVSAFSFMPFQFWQATG